MPLDRPDLSACRAKLAAGSKSFALASHLLPREVREPTAVLYAFCREADDAVDHSPHSGLAVEQQSRRLDRVFSRRPIGPVERALASVIDEWRLPRAPFDALLEGFAWDAEQRSYETITELHGYAIRVAGTVGVLLTTLMGVRAAGVLARACELGVAMQLTNIARDVGEDAARGRLYLPRSWLREAGVDPEAWLARPTATPQLASVVARLLGEADTLYTRADAGIDALPLRCRPAIRVARHVYSDIGRSIRRAAYDSVTRRATVTPLRKLWLLVRALLPTRVSLPPAARTDSSIDAARFLVDACAEG